MLFPEINYIPALCTHRTLCCVMDKYMEIFCRNLGPNKRLSKETKWTCKELTDVKYYLIVFLSLCSQTSFF